MIEDYYTDELHFFRKVQTPDAVGSFTESWEELFTVKGKIRPLSDQEVHYDNKKSFKVTHKLFCASTAEIKRGYGVRYSGRMFVVSNVDNVWEHHLEVQIGEFEK